MSSSPTRQKTHQQPDHWQEAVEWGGWQEVTALLFQCISHGLILVNLFNSFDGGACEFVLVGLHGLSGSMQPSRASGSRSTSLRKPQVQAQQPRGWEQSTSQRPLLTGQWPLVTAVPGVLCLLASGSDSLLGLACTCLCFTVARILFPCTC